MLANILYFSNKPIVFCINILQTLFNDSTMCVFSLLLQYFYRDVFTVHNETCITYFVLQYVLINYRFLVHGWSIVIFQWYFTVNLFFKPMIVQVQDFFKDVNAQCNVLNIRQPVLQVITVLCQEFW